MFAIDIEGRGPSAVYNGIVSIGVCVGDSSGTVLEKRRFDLQPYHIQFMDPKCKAEFWDKHPSLLETLERDAVLPDIGIRNFRQYLDECEQKYGELYILCDNPGYDFHFVNYYLDREGLLPLCMRKTLESFEFRALHDADSYARGYCKQLPNAPWVSNIELVKRFNLQSISETTHMPEDDAEQIFRVHSGLVYTK